MPAPKLPTAVTRPVPRVSDALRSAALAVLETAQRRVYKAKDVDDLEVVRHDLEALLMALAIRPAASCAKSGLPLFPAA